MVRELVVAGWGSISSLGADRETVARGYGVGVDAIRVVPLGVRGGAVPTIPIAEAAEEALKERCRTIPMLAERDRVVQLGGYAALDAVAEARTRGLSFRGRRVGVVCGSARGATGSLEAEHARSLEGQGVSVTASPSTTGGVLASSIAVVCGIDAGMSIDTSMTCTSGLHALLVARALIRAGDLDIAVVVGAEAALTPFTVDQVAALRISPRFGGGDGDRWPCRPFSGEEPPGPAMVLGEGAVAVVVVSELLAGELSGSSCWIASIGCAAEVPPSLTGIGSEGENFQGAMRRALIDGCLTEEDLSGIVCHAPGTPKGDRAEWRALGAVFDQLPPLITSTKWLTGHTYGASGLLSMEFGDLLMAGLIPAAPPFSSYGLRGFGEAVAHGDDRRHAIVVNAAGFGGNAISVVMRREG
jgi:3-oxoacyl-[acyl-carrier-protein] synthase II